MVRKLKNVAKAVRSDLRRRARRNDPLTPTGIAPTARAVVGRASGSKTLEADLQIVRPEQILSFPHPRHVIDEATAWRFMPASKTFMPVEYVATLGNARVWSEDGAVIAEDGRLIADISRAFNTGDDPARHPIFETALSAPVRLKGRTALVQNPGPYNYYHWTIEMVPRLLNLLKAGHVLAEFDQILWSKDRMPYMAATFELLGIDPAKIVPLVDGSHFVCDELVVPSIPGNIGQTPPHVPQEWRRLLTASLPDKPKRRIFLSRAGAKFRRLLNEEALFAEVLKPLGFESVQMENLTLAQQAALWHEAEAVVSPHGAGLTNLVYAPPGTKVVELFAPDYLNWCYYNLAGACEHEYGCVIGEGPMPERMNARMIVAADMTIDTGKLRRMLGEMGVL